jgi:hypothetical protein
MAAPKDPDELELVKKAIVLGLTTTGCCEWKESAARRVREQPPLSGMTPEGIKSLLCECVANLGGEVVQVEEKRDAYQDYPFYYKAIVPVAGFRKGLFVELVLEDSDPDFPAVLIVNAHEQGR